MTEPGSDVAALVEEARACTEKLERENAIELYRRAVQIQPSDPALLAEFGEAALQAGEVEDAKVALQRSIELSPDGTASRYMYLGQLAEGEKALGWFQQGIQRLRSERAALEGAGGSKDDLRREWLAATNALAAGLCAEAEIYLTDACDEDDAEMKCEALATEALLLVSGIDKQTLPEPYQTMASLRLSQQRPEDAEALLAKALSITESLEGSAQQPSLEMRTALSKLLMEVGMSAEALDLLQELRLEDDESLELWYLVVCAALQSGELEIAQAELEQALQFAQSDACPADEREWLPQLMELQSDVDGASRDQLADGEADEMDSSR